MQRTLTPELMDDPSVEPEKLGRSLAYIRAVNRRLGGQAALLRHLNEWSSRWPKDGPITLLDIATGSADLPVAARRWALARGFDLRITGVDLHETTLDFARAYIEEASKDEPRISEGIELRRVDAGALMDHYEPGAFDYVHAGLFLHHLPEIEILTVLRIMERLCRRGLIWNDLVRSRLAHLAIRLLTLRQPEMVRHDARVSVEAGFTKREVLDIARRLDLDWCRYRASFVAQRFTLAGEKT